jgi:hypothetical protein
MATSEEDFLALEGFIEVIEHLYENQVSEVLVSRSDNLLLILESAFSLP